VKVEDRTAAIPAARRHIIRRPRLTRMLDESGARIILLVAPAGYGKTTLAREWLDDPSRRAAWYRGGPASADVAALAVGLAKSAAEIVPGAGDRMRERLKATVRPDDDAVVLAEMLADDLGLWPDDAWLIADDYQFALGSSSSETFVGRLLRDTPIRFLATSRRRPSWASARRRTYGEILEVDRTALAMTEAEGHEVLEGRPDVLRIIQRAQGWPAIIGMAALTEENVVLGPRLPATLYDYFAEELYETVGLDTRWGLCQLAIATSITKHLGTALLGDTFAGILEQAVRLGIAIPGAGDSNAELHPLLRRFLLSKMREFDRHEVDEAILKVARHLLRERKWDDVFEVAQKFDALQIFEELLFIGLTDVLASGRVATVERWIEFASEHYFSSPILDFAEAELSVREGLYTKAETLALQAAGATHEDWRATALTRAGRAAHLGGRPQEAIRHHRAALTSSPSPESEREALWGLVVALVEVEDFASAEVALATLEDKTGADIDDVLRVPSGRYLISVRCGDSAQCNDLISALPLLERSQDPMARSSFLNTCAIALTLNARYEQAYAVASRFFEEADRFRLRFVLPYAQLRLAAVAAGRRDFGAAFEALEKAEGLSPEGADRWMSTALPAVRALILLSAGRPSEALRAMPSVPDGSAGVRAEILAIRALAFACVGEVKKARASADEARTTSSTLEAWSLGSVADAIAACVARDAAPRDLCLSAFQFMAERGTLDHFVVAYRAFPEILGHVAREQDPRLPGILEAAADDDLAHQFTIELPTRGASSNFPLSPREREVFDLLSSGLTNKEIARRLYITESTAKVHIRHIFEKFDAHTRTEAVKKGQELLRRAP
jgi:LuxR family transcriptional regulator, maltose regulon positive regulatory protein